MKEAIKGYLIILGFSGLLLSLCHIAMEHTLLDCKKLYVSEIIVPIVPLACMLSSAVIE